MAANDYYNAPAQQSWNHGGSVPGSPQPYPNPYDHRHSQNTFSSDHDIAAPGNFHNDHYPEEIPLKPNAAQPGPLDADTAYPPALDPQQQRSDDDPRRRHGRRRRKQRKFFSRKTPWVTYFVSLVQVAVFIAEIVKNGVFTIPSLY